MQLQGLALPSSFATRAVNTKIAGAFWSDIAVNTIGVYGYIRTKSACCRLPYILITPTPIPHAVRSDGSRLLSFESTSFLPTVTVFIQ
jgi:hypothetical protein